MPLTETPTISQFPVWSNHIEDKPVRYQPLPTAETLRTDLLFGIPLKSSLTGQEMSDETLNRFISEAISEVEHILDLYITPVQFQEKHDYNKEMFMWSFAYMKVNHPNIISVQQLAISFNNNFTEPVSVDFPKEYIHVMPQEGVLQLVPATGTTLGGFILSIFFGVQFHALRLANILDYPGAIRVTYTAGFENGKIPALLTSIIETIAAIKTLSVMGPILFPYNSVSVGLDGTSQGTSTMGPAFLRQRMQELSDLRDRQIEAAKGYYQRQFLIDML